MARFDERYEIGCSLCGVIGYEKLKHVAIKRARIAKAFSHNDEDEIVSVYDRMTHKGNSPLVLQIRE